MEEYAALVALLQVRPQELSWKDIASEVLEAGSAVEVWERRVLLGLVGVLRKITPVSAARDVEHWVRQDYRLVSILDIDHPARLCRNHPC